MTDVHAAGDAELPVAVHINSGADLARLTVDQEAHRDRWMRFKFEQAFAFCRVEVELGHAGEAFAYLAGFAAAAAGLTVTVPDAKMPDPPRVRIERVVTERGGEVVAVDLVAVCPHPECGKKGRIAIAETGLHWLPLDFADRDGRVVGSAMDDKDPTCEFSRYLCTECLGTVALPEGVDHDDIDYV